MSFILHFCMKLKWKVLKNGKVHFWNFRSFNTQWFDRKNPKFFCSNIFVFLTFLVPILNYMHVVIIWEPERCPTICKQNLTTTKSTQDYYYFLWLDKGKHSWKTTYNIQNVSLTYLAVCWMKKIQLGGWDQGGLYLLPQDRRHRKNHCSFSPCSMVCIT